MGASKRQEVAVKPTPRPCQGTRKMKAMVVMRLLDCSLHDCSPDWKGSSYGHSPRFSHKAVISRAPKSCGVVPCSTFQRTKHQSLLLLLWVRLMGVRDGVRGTAPAPAPAPLRP